MMQRRRMKNQNQSILPAVITGVKTSVAVPYCYLFLLSVFILWFTYYINDIF